MIRGNRLLKVAIILKKRPNRLLMVGIIHRNGNGILLSESRPV